MPRLESSEVLKRSVLKSQTVESADVRLHATIDLRDKRGASHRIELTWSGALADRGRSWQGEAEARVRMRSDDRTADVRMKGEVRSMHDAPVFFLVRELSMTPASDATDAALRALQDRWWKTGGTGAQTLATSDEHWMERQLQAVRVDRDLTPQQSADDHAPYRYEVSIDPDALSKLLSTASDDDRRALMTLKAQGELTIDARTFELQSVVWRILTLETGRTTVTGDVAIDVSAVNGHQTVTKPGGAEEIDLSMIRDFDIISR